MFTRFNGNVVPFADDSTSTNRTVFGGTTQSDLIDDNLNTNFKKGWEIVGLNDNPTREDFNAMGYTLGALTAYLYEMGISEWNASQNYRANSRVTGSDGKIYKSLTGTTGIPNVGNNPTTDAVNWGIDNQFYINSLASKATPVDTDNFGIQETGGLFKKLSWANVKATLKTYFDTLYFALTGDQTIAGIKTFTLSPIVPAPTTSTQVANKEYADTKQTNLGFTPVQQGTGIGQLTNIVAIGWNGSRTKITIDGIDMGNIVMDGDVGVANSSLVKTALNASGTAPIYACRAWVNFNGTGTVAIRASGNVSSITDNGVGSYAVNFSVPMPDANYCVNFSGSNVWGGNNMCYSVATNGNSEAIPTTTSISVTSINQNGSTGDSKYSMVSIFR